MTKKQNADALRHGLRLVLWGFVVLALAGGSGCRMASQTRLPVLYDTEGEPRIFKRYEREFERDFWNHWSRKAYFTPRRDFLDNLNEVQRSLVDEVGIPDYTRRAFLSFTGERVEEWVYLEPREIFQFSGPYLVYEGPLTQFEQIVIQRGYPDMADVRRYDMERIAITLGYQDRFWVKQDVFHFNDDKLIQSNEGN